MKKRTKTFLIVAVVLAIAFVGHLMDKPALTHNQEQKAFFQSNAQHIGSWQVKGTGYSGLYNYQLDIYIYNGRNTAIMTRQDGAITIKDLAAHGLNYNVDDNELDEWYILTPKDSLLIGFYYANAGEITSEFATVAKGIPLR